MNRRSIFDVVLYGLLLLGYSSLLLHPATGQTPEQTKAWELERAQTQAAERVRLEKAQKEREARRADPMAWVRTLDAMSAGGWIFRAVAPDGSWAAYTTEHQMKRSGRTVTLWLRQEFPEPQTSTAGGIYLSNVQKLQYDCAKDLTRVVLVIFYAQNNLAGAQQSAELDPKAATWDPVVPGSQSELVSRWACEGKP